MKIEVLEGSIKFWHILLFKEEKSSVATFKQMNSNSFAALSSKPAAVEPKSKSKSEPKGKEDDAAPAVVEKKREINGVQVPADKPIFMLPFAQLVSALIRAYQNFTKKTPFGDSFFEDTEGIRKLIGEIASLYAHYESDDVDHVWQRYVKTFRIAGADLPAHSAKEDQECAGIETILRCLIAQLRTMKDKSLIVGQGRAGVELCEFQADIDALVEDFLGEAQVSRDVKLKDGTTKAVIAEKLVWELRDAFKTAKAAKDAVWEEKSAAMEAAKKNRDERMKEREKAQAPKWHQKRGGRK